MTIEALATARPMGLTAVRHAMARNWGTGIAMIEGDVELSFEALDDAADRIASMLRQRGVAPGGRVAILLPDGLATVALYLACAQIGAIAVPLNWRLSSAEIAHILHRASPHLLFTVDRFSALVPDGGSPENLVLPDGAAALGALLQLTDGKAERQPASTADPFLMLFTSGTTGTPKGCVLGQAGQAVAALSTALTLGLGPSDRLFSVPPLFHVGGWSGLLAHLIAGASVVFAPQPLTASSWCDFVIRYGCTSASLPPTLRDAVIARADLPDVIAKLRRLSNAGTTMIDACRFMQLRQVFGDRISVGYGLTEAGAFAAQMSAAEQIERLDGCGKLLPHLEARIIDQSGKDVPSGSVGELALRGPSVMLGYWDDATASAAAFVDGWMKTGDMMRIDDQGYLRFAARAKELIKSGGENVYPAEVERLLMLHPAIADCAVAGVRDDVWGEAVKAFIVLAPGTTIELSEVGQWCRSDLAGYKRPRYVEVVDAIPRTPLGKVERIALSLRPVGSDQAI